MSLDFSNLQSQNLEEREFRTGQSFAGILPTNLYTVVVKQVYLLPSQSSKSMAANVIYDYDGGEHSERIYFLNSQGSNVYQDKNTGKLLPLPGFCIVDDLCRIGLGKELKELKTVNVKVKERDFETKSDIVVERVGFPELTNIRYQFCIQEVLDYKQAKNESTGAYENTGEFRHYNRIVNILDLEGHTVVEKAKKLKAAFVEEWLKNNVNKPYDRTNGEYEKAQKDKENKEEDSSSSETFTTPF